jgi:lipid A disaccharide synthetase
MDKTSFADVAIVACGTMSLELNVRIIRMAKALILQDERVRKLHNSIFLVRYSIFEFYSISLMG